jgi:hypothetical protein
VLTPLSKDSLAGDRDPGEYQPCAMVTMMVAIVRFIYIKRIKATKNRDLKVK